MIVIGIVYKQRMLISDIIMEKPFVNPAVIGLINGEIMRFVSLINDTLYHNVIKKAHLALFVNKVKAVGLKIHFIGCLTTYYHTDTG